MPELGIIIRGFSKGDKLVLSTWEQEVLNQTLEANQGNLELVLRRHDPERIISQNDMYWVVLGYMEDYTGHSTNELHKICKHEFNRGKSTTKLSKREFSNYLERTIVLAASLGVNIPDKKRIDIIKEQHDEKAFQKT